MARVTDGPTSSRGGRASVLRATERLLDSSRAICKMLAEPGGANADIFQDPTGSAQEGSQSEMLSSGGTLAGNRWCSPPGPCAGRFLRDCSKVSGKDGGGPVGSQEDSVVPW